MSNITEMNAADILVNNYAEFGEYVNRTRGTVGLDGLKSVYRRILFSLRDVDSSSVDKVPSPKVTARCAEKYHPHGDSYETLVNLVQDGFILPKGNFGNKRTYDKSPGSAARYTYVKTHKEVADGAFRFLRFVPEVINEFGYTEPEILPLPIPVALIVGDLGIGFGVQATYPAFSPLSIFESLLSDNPAKLKAPKGLYLGNDDLSVFWKTGQGRISYSMRCYQQYSNLDDKTVSVIEGPADLFTPDFYGTEENPKLIGQWENDNLLYIRDESSKSMRVCISRVKGLKKITDDMVHEQCLAASKWTGFYRMYINENKKTRRVSMQSWLQELWSRYDKVVNDYKVSEIEDVDHNLLLLSYIPKIGPLVIKDVPSEEIATKIGCDVEIVKEIESKPIRTLRKSDFTNEINNLHTYKKEVAKIDAKIVARDYVNVLEKARTF